VRLDLAAADIADVVTRGGVPSLDFVAFVLNAHGILEAPAKIAVVHDLDHVAGELEAQFGQMTFHTNVRIGIGSAGSTSVGILLYTSPVELAPFERSASSAFELAGTIKSPAYGLERLFMTDVPAPPPPRVTINAHNVVTHPAVTVDGDGRFHATIDCGTTPNIRWISIDSIDDRAPIQYALFPIYCYRAPPTTFQLEAPANVANVPPAAMTRRLISLLNRERQAARLPALRIDSRATQAAERYAQVMRSWRAVGHKIDHTDLLTRLARAGIAPQLAQETVVRATDLGDAIQYIVNDADQRAALESPATHVGVGIFESGDHELYVAVVYVQIGEPIDPVGAADQIEEHLSVRWHKRIDVDLHVLAQRMADRLAAGKSETEVWDEASRAFAGRRYVKVGAVVQAHFELKELSDVALLCGVDDARFGIGIGVAQAPREGPDTGKIWVVNLYGRTP
jgi:uncharacterized protein YkwD